MESCTLRGLLQSVEIHLAPSHLLGVWIPHKGSYVFPGPSCSVLPRHQCGSSAAQEKILNSSTACGLACWACKAKGAQ